MTENRCLFLLFVFWSKLFFRGFLPFTIHWCNRRKVQTFRCRDVKLCTNPVLTRTECDNKAALTRKVPRQVFTELTAPQLLVALEGRQAKHFFFLSVFLFTVLIAETSRLLSPFTPYPLCFFLGFQLAGRICHPKIGAQLAAICVSSPQGACQLK